MDKKEIREPLLVSRHAAAELLGVCLRTLDKFIAFKMLPSRRVGRRVLIPHSALLAFARRDHPTKPDPGATSRSSVAPASELRRTIS
jgi:excisionase family DNA binding protein